MSVVAVTFSNAAEPPAEAEPDSTMAASRAIESRVVNPIIETIRELCAYRERHGRWPHDGDFPGGSTFRYESYQLRFLAEASYDTVFVLPGNRFEWQLLLETDHPADKCDKATLFLRGAPASHSRKFRYAVRGINDASWTDERRRELLDGIIVWTARNVVLDESADAGASPAAQEFAAALAAGLVEGLVKGVLCVLLKVSPCP